MPILKRPRIISHTPKKTDLLKNKSARRDALDSNDAERTGPSVVVSKQQPQQVFFNAEYLDDIHKLEAATGITILGGLESRKSWKALVYRSNEGYNFGLIAKEGIKKETEIVPYLGMVQEVTPDQEYTERQEAYAFEFDTDHTVFADKFASIAAFGNHSSSIPNMYAEQVNGEIKYIAKENIPAGCALLINYGIAYNYASSFTYLCPYQNGRSPAENYRDYKDFFNQQPVQLDLSLKKQLGIESSSAEYYVVPKIYDRPNLVKSKGRLRYIEHRHLPIYLMGNGEILPEQPYIFPLILAGALKEYTKIKPLLDINVDVFAQTQQGLSVLKIITTGVTKEDCADKAYKEALKSILKNILSHFASIYTQKGFGKHFERQELKTMKVEKFVEYVEQEVSNPIALKLISSFYKRYNFNRLTAQEKTTPSETTTAPKPFHENKCSFFKKTTRNSELSHGEKTLLVSIL